MREKKEMYGTICEGKEDEEAPTGYGILSCHLAKEQKSDINDEADDGIAN